MHLAHSNNKSADRVESGLLLSPSTQMLLHYTIIATDFCDRTEEKTSKVRKLVDPIKLYCTRDALKKRVMLLLKGKAFRHIFWLIVASSHRFS
jgi:hypothetical protein